MLNKTLNNTVLLGTDRKNVETAQLHPEITKRLDKGSSQEQLLLDSLSYDYIRNLHGSLPVQIEKAIIPQAIKESQAYVSTALSTLIVDVLAEKQYISKPMLIEILEFVVAQKKILRPESIIQLLKHNLITIKQVSNLSNAVLGKRGQQLLELFPHFVLPPAEITATWAEGTAAERLKIFKNWRSTKSQSGLDELKADWESENIRTKLGFLKVIAENLEATDGDFLSSIYLKEYADKKITRKTDKECKKQLISALVRLERISILDELQEKLNPYIEEVKGKKQFKKLKKEDDFWNGLYLSEWLGLSEKNLDLARFDYDPLYWLGEMIEILPFGFWGRLLDKDAKECLTYLLTDKQFQVKITKVKEPIYLASLIRNAQLTQDQELLEQLSMTSYSEEDSGPLMALFSDAQFERYITDNKLWSELHLISQRLKVTETPWSKAFSETFLKEVQEAVSNGGCYPDHNFGAALTGAINSQALPYLKEIHDKVLYESWFQIWNNGIIKPIIRKMNLTERFHKIKKEENEQT